MMLPVSPSLSYPPPFKIPRRYDGAVVGQSNNLEGRVDSSHREPGDLGDGGAVRVRDRRRAPMDADFAAR